MFPWFFRSVLQGGAPERPLTGHHRLLFLLFLLLPLPPPLPSPGGVAPPVMLQFLPAVSYPAAADAAEAAGGAVRPDVDVEQAS